MCQDSTGKVLEGPDSRGCSRLGQDNKRRYMIYKILGGVVLALVVLVVVGLEVRTTGSYERTFDASRDKVWRVWNDEDSIKHWWGPTGYTAPFIRNDLRVGGTYLWAMKSSKGEMFWNTGFIRKWSQTKGSSRPCRLPMRPVMLFLARRRRSRAVGRIR